MKINRLLSILCITTQALLIKAENGKLFNKKKKKKKKKKKERKKKLR